MESRTQHDRQSRAPRQSVTEAGANIRLTDRDLWILEALGRMRFLRTSQLARLFFEGSRSPANKRLRRLFDQSLVRVWVTGLAHDNLYSLTTRGRARVGVGGTNLHCPRGLEGNLEHLLAINDTRIAFVVGMPGIGARLKWWRSDWELRAHARASVIPDALFAIDCPGMGSRTYSLEVDRKTKSPQGFLKKLTAYRGVRYRAGGLYGEGQFTVLVVGHDPRWVDRYRAVVEQSTLDVDVLFASLDDVCRMGPWAPIWWRAGSTEPALLQDQTLPYGKEGFRRESAGESTRCGEGSARVLLAEEST